LCRAQSSQFDKSFRSQSQECEIRHIPGTNPRLGESDQAFRTTERRGEPDAYFHLRRLGYVIVARNHRAPRQPGEIKLIGRSAELPGFIEVKTRTSRGVKPPEAAADRHKRREVAALAREYLRRQPPSCQWRFDRVSVYYPQSSARQPPSEVFRNAPLSA
jgi:Holliday junction resolvase-like predicted endonuclease